MTRSDALLNARILIIDDQEINLRLLELILQREGFTNIRMLSDPYEVLPTYIAYQPDIILLDLLMPGLDGFSIMELLRRRIPAEVFLPILVLTADVGVDTRRRALALGAKDFLTKPFDPIEVMLRLWNLLETRFMYRQLEEYNQQLGAQVQRGRRELDAAQTEVVWRLAQASEFRDEETGMHTQRVGRLSALLARRLSLEEEQVELLRHAAPLHDVGKIGIPDHILLKPGRLSADEYQIMKQHAEIGFRIISGSNSELVTFAATIAHTHHEQWAGTGYPQGLRGEEIPIEGRIAAVADVFDALTSARPYKKAWPISEAVAHLEAGAGAHFDPELTRLFVGAMDEVLAIRERFSDEPTRAS